MGPTFKTVAMPNWKWNNIDLLRQTHRTKGQCGNTIYVRGKTGGCDYILMGMNDSEDDDFIAQYPKERRILTVMENPEIWSPPQKTVSSAGILISPFKLRAQDGTRVVRSQPGVPWFYGISFATDAGLDHIPLENNLGLTELTVMQEPTKKRLLSIIVSGKGAGAGYRWRTELAKSIKGVLGSECDLYGFGHRPINDKREALDEYKYTLVMENTSQDYYWTEKIADAYLGFCIPIYAGAPNIQRDFKGRIHQIEYGSDILAATKQVVRIVTSGDEEEWVSMIENRGMVLHEHNLFYMIAGVLGHHLESHR